MQTLDARWHWLEELAGDLALRLSSSLMSLPFLLLFFSPLFFIQVNPPLSTLTLVHSSLRVFSNKSFILLYNCICVQFFVVAAQEPRRTCDWNICFVEGGVEPLAFISIGDTYVFSNFNLFIGFVSFCFSFNLQWFHVLSLLVFFCCLFKILA